MSLFASTQNENPQTPGGETILKLAGNNCQKCGASNKEQVPSVRYAKDTEHGERLLIKCWLCGYQFTKPVVK